MLFGFYILVFLNINYAGINGFALRQNKVDGGVNTINTTKAAFVADPIIRNNATTRHFFKMIKNLTSTKSKSNLKSNVFDKMLFNEMLSIKEHLFEKDLSQVSLLLPTNTNGPTPTLELKQKWPFVEKIKDDHKNKSTSKIIETEIDFGKTINDTGDEGNSNKKVLGLRSLSAHAHPHPPFRGTNGKSHNNDSHSFKIYKSSASSSNGGCNNKCGHSDTKACTRIFQYPTIPMYTYPTYQTIILEISTYSPYIDYIYHETTSTKKHKHKHKHKTTKHFDEESLYYDNSKEGFFKGYDYSYKEDDDYLANEKDSLNENKVIIDIDYDLKDKKRKTSKTTINWENGYIKDVIKEKLVDTMVKDLKQQYADAVLKDCYCSAYSFHTNITLYHTILLVLTIFWLLKKLI